jgi:hypothetical protein
VFIHYRSGSSPAMETATAIAQRLLFSDFSYADTRSASAVSGGSSVRYFYPEDAAAAARLADLLRGTGIDFHVADLSASRGRAPRGTLDVWIDR